MVAERIQRHVRERLGFEADACSRCRIGEIPQPPQDVHAVAGNGPLRPGRMRPLGMLGTALGAPFKLFKPVLAVAEWVDRVISVDNDTVRAEKNEVRQRDKAISGLGLDRVFDGNWQGQAGQLLLRWYGQSPHPWRFVVLAGDRVVLAAPRERVTIRELQRMETVAEFPGGQAVVEDPMADQRRSDRLRLRFADGSWLVLITQFAPSVVHTYLRTKPEGASPSA